MRDEAKQNAETLDAQEPTIFGYPVQVTLKVTDRAPVDVTHALQWDGKNVTLDMNAVRRAINGAYVRDYGPARPATTTPPAGLADEGR